MQKKKKNTLKRVEPESIASLFEYVDEVEENIAAVNMMSAMMEPMLDSTMELTKLIIENRLRNNQIVDESEIYEIHKRAFNHCMNNIEKQD